MSTILSAGCSRATSAAWEATVTDPWAAQTEALGAFIRSQRELASLSLRQLAELTSLSHPYLSQVERGVHQPSVRVLKLIAEALNVSAETLLVQAGLLSGHDQAQADGAHGTEQVTAVIRADQRLTEAQKAALIAVYDSMLRD
jgi:transcriptional regulator with XRE-family HTH domain